MSYIDLSSPLYCVYPYGINYRDGLRHVFILLHCEFSGFAVFDTVAQTLISRSSGVSVMRQLRDSLIQ